MLGVTRQRSLLRNEEQQRRRALLAQPGGNVHEGPIALSPLAYSVGHCDASVS